MARRVAIFLSPGTPMGRNLLAPGNMCPCSYTVLELVGGQIPNHSKGLRAVIANRGASIEPGPYIGKDLFATNWWSGGLSDVTISHNARAADWIASELLQEAHT
jgi:hypothetical protein